MKVINPCNSLSVAQKVRRMVNKLNTDSRLCSRAWWESFDNCREQGFVLHICPVGGAKDLRIAVAENRNSDDIVVYCYTKIAFPTNLPAEDQWSDRTFFNLGEYKKAATYILCRARAFLNSPERE